MLSVDPIVRPGRRLFLVLVDVDLKALAIALVLPVGDRVADVVEERTAAKIDPADEHAAKMADVADVAAPKPEGSEKFEDGHRDDVGTHGHFDGNRKHDDLAVRERDGACQQDSKNRAGGADRRYVGGRTSPKNRNGIHDDVDETRADSREKVILKKMSASPDQFQFAPEHVQHEHVREDVPDGRAVVEKEIRKRLPEAQAVRDGGRHQTKSQNKPVVGRYSREGSQQNFKEKYPNVGDQQPLDGGRQVEIKAEPIVSNARPRRHDSSSVRRYPKSVKVDSPGSVQLLAGEIEKRRREKREHENAEKIAGGEWSHNLGAKGKEIRAPGESQNGSKPMRCASGDFRVLQ